MYSVAVSDLLFLFLKELSFQACLRSRTINGGPCCLETGSLSLGEMTRKTEPASMCGSSSLGSVHRGRIATLAQLKMELPERQP
jgi:hypothetical protein